jgi:hypothetical protein
LMTILIQYIVCINHRSQIHKCTARNFIAAAVALNLLVIPRLVCLSVFTLVICQEALESQHNITHAC